MTNRMTNGLAGFFRSGLQLIASLMCVAALPLAASAQETSAGTITGRVSNSATPGMAASRGRSESGARFIIPNTSAMR